MTHMKYIPTSREETKVKFITPEDKHRRSVSHLPMANSGKTKKLMKALRNRKIIQARKEGKSYEEISEEFGLSKSACAYIIQRFLGELHERTLETAEEIRTIDGLRLDALQHSLWEKAMKGQEGAINTCLKILERRAKLFGMDMDKNGIMINNNNGPITRIVVEKVKSPIQDDSNTIDGEVMANNQHQISSDDFQAEE